MKNNFQSNGKGKYQRVWQLLISMLFILTMGIGQMWGADFDVTLDQFRTKPISGLVKIDNSDLSLSGGALQLSSGNKDFTVSTTNTDYKIKEIVFTTTKAVISYGGDAISDNTFTPATPGTSFTLNLAASGGTAKITKMVVTLTTSTSETLEALVTTAINDGVYTTESSVITLSTVGGTCNTTSGQEYINISKSSGTRSLTITTNSSYNIKFIALAYYDAIFSRTISASTGTYTAASYLWTPGATPTNTVTLTFNTGNSEGAKIRRVIVGYESTSGGGCTNVGIGTQPTSPVAATIGSACSITGLVASGTNPTYQWQTCNSDGSNATNISAAGDLSFTGYTTATLGLTPTAEGATYYKCVVSGECGDPVTSNVVTVNASPAYTVTYNDNGKTGGGAAPSDATAYASGAEVTVLGNPNDMTKTNCVFMGWNTKADGTGTVYMEGEKFNMPSENKTLYAMWGVKLSWVVQVNVEETTVTTTSTASSYTTAVAAPSNLALTDLSVTASKKGTATNKISTTKAKGGYISATFAVQDGYEFTPTHMVLKTTAITEAITVEVNVGDEVQTWAQPKSGADPDLHVYKFADPEAITGSGTMKIYAYGGEDGTKGYRLGTPIEIYGYVTAAAAPASGWSLRGSFDTWGDGYAMSEAGTNIVRVERTLNANTHYQFKIFNGSDWYGDGETFGGTKTQTVSATGTANNCHLVTSEEGTYRFEYNTESHALTITYPHSYTYYYSNTDSWEHVYVYKFSYNEETGSNAAWPGVEITTPTAMCGDYYAATSDGYAMLIFNNGLSGDDEKKTGDMVVASDDEGKYVAGTGSAWTAMSTYTISFVGNGNTSGEMSDIASICPTTDQALTANAFAKTGYNFAGWVANVDVTVGGATVSAGTVIANEATIQNISSNIALTAQWTVDCPTEGTVYSLLLKDDVANASLDKNGGTLNLTSTHVTVTNGASALIKNTDTSNDGKMQIKSHQFYFNGNNAYLKIEMLCALEAGDEIEMTGGKDSREFYITPNECAKPSDDADAVKTSSYKYTVKATDTKLVGVSTLYIGRDGSGTYTTGVKVTRPEKFSVTYYKNDGSATTVDAPDVAVVAANMFSRSGYRFIEWNTQADGNGSKVNVGAAVTADIELFAIWAQEYTVSYANTGAASGDAPTNENKYITGETFKVAGIGTMVAAADHAFGGWNDGSTTYQENDDYTVGTENVSFTPVWNETFNVYYYPNGGSGTAYTAANASTVNECFFAPAAGKLFDKWTTQEDGTGDVYAPGAAVTTSINLYAQWKDDECTARQSLIAVTFTGETAATAVVNGYNEKEYASAALINKLGDNSGPSNGGYKIYGDGGYIFATIAKGDFQEGDKLEVEVTQVPASQKLDVYAYGDNIATAYKVVSIEQVSAAGTYSYALTAANAAAINALGYKSLGIYRATESNMNAYVKSLSITGCRVWVVNHDVTFDLNGQTGSAPAAQSIAEGGLVTKPADPDVDGQFFRGWYKEAGCEHAWDFANDVVGTEDVVLYAKWEADPCDNRRSIVKAVTASTSTATVTGYNDNEYAGGYLLNGLGAGDNCNTYNFGEGTVTGYKLTGNKSAIMATLAKGGFAEGDKVIIAVTKEADGGKLPIYVAKDKDNAVSIVNLDVTAPGIYTYTLTAANIATIEAAGEGYMSIGAYRGTYNPFIYSVELTGCRNWSVYHTLTFKNADGSATLASESLAEGAYASTIAPAAPRIKGKRFLGWSESVDGALVTMTSYSITTDMILYAVYEDVECPTSGTVYKFQFKTGLDDETLGVSDNKDMSEYVNASGDGYLTYTSSANNYAAITTDSLIQMKNIAAYLKVDLDCALAAGDRIRVRCYNNPIRVQVGTTYEASKDLEFAKNDFGWQDVTASMVGKSDLYITRASNGNANLAYFEIYRRPVLTGIEMADMTLRINQALAPQVTLLPEGALVTSQAWAITAREGASDAEISSTTGVISAGSETGTLTVQATYNGDKVATCTVTIINVYESLVPVTGTTNWNWAGAASSETKINDVANRGVILANYINGANFEKLEGIAGEYEYAYRNNSYPGFQGTQLHFVTTVPGMLTITARNSGSGQRVYVNNHEVTTSDLTSTPTDYMIAVPAGDVTITSSTGQNMRIYAMKFDTNLAAYALTDNVLNGYTRTVAAGQYGTICLATDGVMTGGILFEIAYYDSETRKIFFDEVLNGEMIADRPYVFLPEENSTQLKVFYTEEENAEVTAGHYNGLWGTYVDLNSSNTTESPLWHNYIISNNMYIRVTGSNCTLRKNRAYIKFGTGEVPESPTALLPGRRRISLGTNSTEVATDIDNVQGDNIQCTKVMIDGQLYILRGEKMYDATGRMVK